MVPRTAKAPTVITEWDWRFRIAFDDVLRERVRRASATLQDPRERDVQFRLLDAYEELLSLDALLEALESGPADAERYLDEIGGRTLLPLPRSAVARAKERLAALPLTDGARRPLERLADRAVGEPVRNRERDLLGTTFGDDLEPLLAWASSRSESPRFEAAGAPLSKEAALARIKSLRAGEPESTAVWQRLGLETVPSFDIDVRDDSGFAEYWPRELTGAPGDRLIVFVNDDALRARTLDATLRHELLGHAYFYERLRHAQPTFVDHGALGLVEGWATWCEWGLDDGRDAGRLAPLSALNADGEGLVAALQDNWRRVGYSSVAIDGGLQQLAQYPGMQFSYLLGAAWFSRRFEHEDPVEFFDSLQQRAWGDFFVAWS